MPLGHWQVLPVQPIAFLYLSVLSQTVVFSAMSVLGWQPSVLECTGIAITAHMQTKKCSTMLICEGCTNICHVFIIFCDIFFILLHYIDKLEDAIVIFDTGFRNLSKLLNMTEIGTAYTDEQSIWLHFLVCMLTVVVIPTVHSRVEGMSSQ